MIRGFGNVNQFNDGGGEGGPSCMDKIKSYWTSIPIITKGLVSLTIIFYILSWIKFFNPLLLLLLNTPLYTITRFQIWTIVTTIVITPSILNIIFAFMSWLPKALVLEREIGSIRFLLNIISRTAIIQIMYIATIFLLYLIFRSNQILMMPSMGLWPLIMADITISCMENPNSEVMFFFIPYPIKAKYYPWVLMGFFTLLNFNIQFDLFCGIGFGYLFVYKLKEKLEFSTQFVTKVESNCIFKCIRNNPSFVPSGVIGSFGLSGPQNQNNSATNNSRSADNSNFESQNTSDKPTTNFKAFAGKGTVVGGDSKPKVENKSENLSVVDSSTKNNSRDEGVGYHKLGEDVV